MLRTRISLMNKNNGLTLMEVLVSVAILSIALIAVLKSNLQIQDTLLQGQDKTNTSLLLANKMAEVKAAGTDNWSDYYGQFENFPQYSWEVDITAAGNNFLSKITVTLIETKNKEEIHSIEGHIFKGQES